MGLYDVNLASARAASGLEAGIERLDKTTIEALKNLLLQKFHAIPSAQSSASDVISYKNFSPSNELGSPQ